MATFSGSDGVVLVGSNAIGEIKSYSVEETADTLEDSSMGDTYRTFKSSLQSWSGSCEVLFDDTDTTGQGACTPGSSISLSFQMEGSTTGDHKLNGNAIVTGRTITASFDGLVEASLTFQGTGTLSEGTVA
jgi:hypothetical protein